MIYTMVAVMLTIDSLQYPQNGRIGENTINQWWGNTVFKNTTDWYGIPLRRLAPNETFGYAWDAPPLRWRVTDDLPQTEELVARMGLVVVVALDAWYDCMYFMFGHCVDAAVIYMFQFEHTVVAEERRNERFARVPGSGSG